MLARAAALPSIAVSVEIRSITPDDALAYRRAIRGGFHDARHDRRRGVRPAT